MAKLKIHKNKYLIKKEKLNKQKEINKFRKEILIPFLIGFILLIAFIAFCINNIVNYKNIYFKVGDISISEVEFNYYKKYAINTWIESNEELIEEKKLDIDKAFDKQQYNQEWTWKDFFDYQTTNLIQQTKIFINEAKKEGYKLDKSSEYKKTKEKLKTLASSQNLDFNKYLKREFGEKANEELISKIIKEQYLAIEYYEKNKDTKKLNDEELDNFYYENSYKFDSVDYRYFIFSNSDYSNAKELADKFELEIEDEKSFKELCKKYSIDEDKEKYEDDTYSKATNITMNQLSEEYQGFLFSAREPGDTKVIYDEDIDSFVVLYFIQRYLDDYDVYSFRQLYIKDNSKPSIVEISKLWEDSNKTEETFIKLIKQYSEDLDTKESGGLYENKEYGSMNSEINDWLYKQTRNIGDYGLIKLDKGSSLIYISDKKEANWKEQARNLYESSIFEDWLVTQKKIFEITDPNKNLKFNETNQLLE